ncbi:MAG: hypothetical protein IKN74_03630 [Clostridia bacterium]|nr:hypothetical protein [Clostridia bacterium]
MSNDEKFEFDIANLRKDFEMENMVITPEDVEMLRRYNNNEFTMNEMINSIKKDYLKDN